VRGNTEDARWKDWREIRKRENEAENVTGLFHIFQFNTAAYPPRQRDLPQPNLCPSTIPRVSQCTSRYSSLIGAPTKPQYFPSQRASISNPQTGPHLPYQPPRPLPLPLPYPPSPHPLTQRRPHLVGNTAGVPKKPKACVPAVASGPRDTTPVMGVARFPHRDCTTWRRILLPHHRMRMMWVTNRMERRLRVMMG
jgi:hypothetical protein